MDFVLASASPRRRELLKKVVDCFEVDAATGEEKADRSLSPCELVCFLARQKAREVAAKSEHAEKIVLGADTVVVYNGEVLGKPKDGEDAKRMLRLLSGKEHSVLTGVCVIDGRGEEHIAYDETKVFFEDFSEAFIERYVASGSPLDKAGAYGIQDGVPVKKIEGNFDNVVGLPTALLRDLLCACGIAVTKEKEKEE